MSITREGDAGLCYTRLGNSVDAASKERCYRGQHRTVLPQTFFQTLVRISRSAWDVNSDTITLHIEVIIKH